MLDKETGVTKVAHHEHLARLCGVAYPEMTFVDDKVNHLDAVGALGVRCALVGVGLQRAARARAGARERPPGLRARRRRGAALRANDVDRQPGIELTDQAAAALADDRG